MCAFISPKQAYAAVTSTTGSEGGLEVLAHRSSKRLLDQLTWLDFVLESPIVLGHESAGTIVEVGSAVKNIKVGDRVAVEPGVPCRQYASSLPYVVLDILANNRSSCRYCRQGSYNLCPDTVFAATPPHDSTLSKYYITQSDYCYPIPEHMGLDEGAMVEPVAVAV